MMKDKEKEIVMDKIMIDIKSTIKQIDGDVQTIEMVTEGEIYEKNNSIFLIYHESEVSGMEGSKTMLKISSDSITMTRFGSTNSKIDFDVNHPMESMYRTPYGDFEMKVNTELLEHKIDMDKLSGYIKVDYLLVLEHLSSSENHLEINIRS